MNQAQRRPPAWVNFFFFLLWKEEGSGDHVHSSLLHFGPDTPPRQVPWPASFIQKHEV